MSLLAAIAAGIIAALIYGVVRALKELNDWERLRLQCTINNRSHKRRIAE